MNKLISKYLKFLLPSCISVFSYLLFGLIWEIVYINTQNPLNTMFVFGGPSREFIYLTLVFDLFSFIFSGILSSVLSKSIQERFKYKSFHILANFLIAILALFVFLFVRYIIQNSLIGPAPSILINNILSFIFMLFLLTIVSMIYFVIENQTSKNE